MGAFVLIHDSGTHPADSDVRKALRFLRPDLDGHEVWSSGATLIARSRFLALPEDQCSELPEAGVAADAVCVADARIDNRDELVPLLRPWIPGSDASDTALILAAYRRWGVDCVDHLLGDFAFAIHDRGRGVLLAAGDPFGIRQLRYASRERRLVLGTNGRAVSACLATRPQLNEDGFLDHLKLRYDRWLEETPYRGVLRLPPGYALVATHGVIARRRYCRIGQRPPERFATDERYLERFEELLTQSVAARMRSRAAVAISLSGGLDSSAIACVARRIGARGGSTRLAAYSFVFDCTAGADERHQILTVLESCQISGRQIVADDQWFWRDMPDVSTYRSDDIEVFGDRAKARRLAGMVAEDGCGALLTGHGGDEVLIANYGTSAALADVPWNHWQGELAHFRRRSKTPSLLLLKAALQKYLNSDWCDWRTRGPLAPPSLTSWTSRQMYGHLFSSLSILRRSSYCTLLSNTNVGWRFPFLDRRLVEFLMGIPWHLRLFGGANRVILRRGLKSVLPPIVRDRMDKARFNGLVGRGIARERRRFEALLAQSLVVQRGWVEPQQVRSWMDLAALRCDARSAQQFSAWLAVEEWLAQENTAAVWES